MASALPASSEEDRVSAMSAAMLSLGERIASELGRGGLDEVYVRGTTGYVLLRSVGADAVLTGVETRTSSPVRITRDPDTLQSLNVRGLYPAGEGAGYAGGIVSAAMDGERCAEAAARKLVKKGI